MALKLYGAHAKFAEPGAVVLELPVELGPVVNSPSATGRTAKQADQGRGSMLAELTHPVHDRILLVLLPAEDRRPNLLGPQRRESPLDAALLHQGDGRLVDQTPLERSAERVGRHTLAEELGMLERILMWQGERFDGEVQMGNSHGCFSVMR